MGTHIKYIGLIVCVVASFLFGYNANERTITETKEKVITKVEVDTLVKYYPQPYIVTLSDTIHVKDTILIKETKEYKDVGYYVKISGYSPNLEELQVFNRNVFTTKEIVKTETKKANKWGLGITAGYGFSKDGLSPAIVIGISYMIR